MANRTATQKASRTAAPASTAPAKGAARKAAPAPAAAAPQTAGLQAQFMAFAKKVDQAAYQQGYANSTQGGGGRWTPPPDNYILKIIPGSELKEMTDKKTKEEYLLFNLAVEITGAEENQDLVGETFEIPFWIRPREDDAGNLVIYDAGTLKGMSEKLFGSEIEDLGECIARIGEEGVDAEFNVACQPRKKGTGVNFYFNELVTAVA